LCGLQQETVGHVNPHEGSLCSLIPPISLLHLLPTRVSSFLS